MRCTGAAGTPAAWSRSASSEASWVRVHSAKRASSSPSCSFRAARLENLGSSAHSGCPATRHRACHWASVSTATAHQRSSPRHGKTPWGAAWGDRFPTRAGRVRLAS